MKEDIAYFNARIRDFYEQAGLPLGEVQCIYTRKNVQMWMITRSMTLLEKMACQESGGTALNLYPVWKVARQQMRDAFIQIFVERYTVHVEQLLLFDIQTDIACNRFFQPLVIICSEAITNIPVRSQREEVLSRTTAKHVRELLGKGPQQVKVYDFDHYGLYRYTGVLTDELQRMMSITPVAEGFFTNLYSFALQHAMNKSLAVLGYKGGMQFILEDYPKNEVSIFVEISFDGTAASKDDLLQIG